MAGTVSVHMAVKGIDPVLVTVPIRPIHSDARLSLLGFFTIGTVPFPLETLCRHPLSGGPGRLLMI